MRVFVLRRNEDQSFPYGIRVVAEGVVFEDGSVVVRWLGDHRSTVVWNSLEDALAIHGHDGKTMVEFSQSPPSFQYYG
jgi:hypothetical protein